MSIIIEVGFSGYVRGNYSIDKEQLLEDMYGDIESEGDFLRGETIEEKARYWIESNYHRYLEDKEIVRDDTKSDIYIEIE